MPKAIYLTIKTNLVLICQQVIAVSIRVHFLETSDIIYVDLYYTLPAFCELYIYQGLCLGFVFPHSIPPSSLHH